MNLRRAFDRHPDIILVVVWSLLAVLLTITPVVSGSSLRSLVVGGYAAIAPGYAAVAVLYPDKDRLGFLERLVLSFGVSVSTIVFIGLFLNVSVGVQVWSVLLGITSLTLVLTALAILRRSGVPEESPPVRYTKVKQDLRNLREAVEEAGGGRRWLQALVLVSAVFVLVSGVYAATNSLPSETYTEFYVLGPDGTPETLNQSRDTGVFAVGVTNHEHRETNYAVQVQLNQTHETQVVEVIRDVRLRHGETWTRKLSLDPTTKRTKAELLLFKGDPPGSPLTPDEAYRYTYLLLNRER